MRILYFYQYFSTPQGSWGTRVYEFAKEWVEKGHDVTVVSSIYSKSDLHANKFVENQTYDGITVKVLNIKIDNRNSVIKRIWSFIQYAIVSSYYALSLPADVVIASSGPITVGIPGLVARYLRGRKLVFEVRDLWPEGAIELGVIKNSILKKISYWFEKLCYKSSSYIITLSPGMTKNIQSRFNFKNIDDVTNAANIALFEGEGVFSSQLQSKSYAIYTGNIGMVNNSSWLYEASKILKELGRDDIKVVLVGEGQQKEELVLLAKQEMVDNFIILDLMPKKDLVPYIQNSFASLVPLKGTPVLDTSSPNKLFESLAAGIPVIQTTQGWMKSFLDKYNVGYTLNPNNPSELARCLISMKDNHKVTQEMGVNAKSIAKKYFDKTYLADKMLNILLKVFINNEY